VTNYNGDKPKPRQPKRRQNGKAKTATHLNGDNEHGHENKTTTAFNMKNVNAQALNKLLAAGTNNSRGNELRSIH